MKLLVKVLSGGRCILEVTKTTSILEIKQKVEDALQVPYYKQTLVHVGKVLSNQNIVGFYNKIQDGDKLHVVIKKPKTLYVILQRFLLKHYTEEQTKQILAEFTRVFNSTLETLSLDDLERIAVACMNDE